MMNKLIAAAILLPSTLFGVGSVTHKGVTFTFDGDYTVGQYQDGNYYVVAPSGLSITDLDPAWNGIQHGAQLNPIPESVVPRGTGFDTRFTNQNEVAYDTSLNVADDLPLAMTVGDCLLVARGNADVGGVGRPIHDVVPLIIVSSAPPDYSFRPPYAGPPSNRINYGTIDDIDISWLPNLEDPGVSTINGPSFVVSKDYDSIALELIGSWGNSKLKTELGPDNYGRSIAYDTSLMALWLCLDKPEADKRTVLRYLVQHGIDQHGLLKAGMNWWPNGGHNNGRKIVLGIAAKALNSNDMLDWLNGDLERFQEDGQHDYITQRDVDEVSTNANKTPYPQSEFDNWNETGGPMPEWFSNLYDQGERDKSGYQWEKKYRDVNGGPNVGTALAAELMGLKDAWNRPAFFEYIEHRYWPTEETNRSTSLNEIYRFPAAMWDAYKGTPPPAPSGDVSTPAASVAAGTYDTEQSVTLVSSNADTIYYTLDGAAPDTGSTVYSGAISISETTTLRAFAVGSGLANSDELVLVYVIRVKAPSSSPPPGAFFDPANVSLSTATIGASIYYTLDGTTPNDTDTLYSSPISISETTTIKSVAVKSGSVGSAISSHTYTFENFDVLDTFETALLGEPLTNAFDETIYITPTSDTVDLVVGLAEGPADDWSDLACIVLFNTTGQVQARNGGVYASDASLSYSGNVTYAVRFIGSLSTHTYDVFVTPIGGTAVQIADDYAFRTEQASVTSLTNVSFIETTGQGSTLSPSPTATTPGTTPNAGQGGLLLKGSNGGLIVREINTGNLQVSEIGQDGSLIQLEVPEETQ